MKVSEWQASEWDELVDILIGQNQVMENGDVSNHFVEIHLLQYQTLCNKDLLKHFSTNINTNAVRRFVDAIIVKAK